MVDRDWLSKLLRKHASRHPCMPSDLVAKALVVAPMVDASDLPYRLLARRYNANLCFTPMIHARMFTERPKYREKFWRQYGMPAEDRPLIAQLCGHDKDVLLQAAKILEGHVDGVDINCGCPQGIARRGQYGAYLMEAEGGDIIVGIVEHLVAHLSVPVSVKLRILPDGLQTSLALYERLVNAGAAMVTIHGRTRMQKGQHTGSADWEAIRRVVELVGDRVPVLANGNISNLDDVRRCLRETGADGVMSSEGVLEYPALFTETNTEATGHKRTGPGRVQMAEDYLALCRRYPPDEGGQGSGPKCIRAHLHRFLHADLQRHTELRDALVRAYSVEALGSLPGMVRAIQERNGHNVLGEQLSWYVRHRQGKDGANYPLHPEALISEEEKKERTREEEEEEQSPCDLFGEVCGDEADY